MIPLGRILAVVFVTCCLWKSRASSLEEPNNSFRNNERKLIGFAAENYNYVIHTGVTEPADPRFSTETLKCVETVIADEWKKLVEEYAETELNVVGKDGGRVTVANHTTEDRIVILTIDDNGNRDFIIWEEGWASGHRFNDKPGDDKSNNDGGDTGKNEGGAEPPPAEDNTKNDDTGSTGEGEAPEPPPPGGSNGEKSATVGGGGRIGYGGWARRLPESQVVEEGDMSMYSPSRTLAAATTTETAAERKKRRRKKKRNKKKKTRRRKWQAAIQVDTKCGDLCTKDNGDQGRRIMTADRELQAADFETWMNDKLTAEVKAACQEATKIARSTFEML